MITIKAQALSLFVASAWLISGCLGNGCQVVKSSGSGDGRGDNCPSGFELVARSGLVRSHRGIESYEKDELCCPDSSPVGNPCYTIGTVQCAAEEPLDLLFRFRTNSDFINIDECTQPYSRVDSQSCSGTTRTCCVTRAPTGAPTCATNERVVPGSCDQCKEPWETTGPLSENEKCSTCKCLNGGNCQPFGNGEYRCACPNNNFQTGGLCSECVTEGFELASGCTLCSLGKAGPTCSDPTQCINGVPRQDQDTGCRVGTCSPVWPGVDQVAAWTFQGANCESRGSPPSQLLTADVGICDLSLSAARSGFDSAPSTYCSDQTQTASGRDLLQGTLVACAEAYLLGNQPQKAKSALELSHRCILEQAAFESQPLRLPFVQNVKVLIDQYDESQLAAIGLGPQVGNGLYGLRSSIDALVNILEPSGGGAFDLGRACKYLCPCGKFSSLQVGAESGCDLDTGADFTRKLELARLHAGFCPSWVATNQAGTIIQGTHLAKALFCARDEAIEAAASETTPPSAARVRLASVVLAEAGNAAQGVIGESGREDGTQPSSSELADELYVADRVLRAYRRTLALDRESSSSFVPIGHMPLFSAATLNQVVAPGTTGATLELAERFLVIADQLSSMEQSEFQFQENYAANADSLDLLLTTQAAQISTGFNEQFEAVASSLELEALALTATFEDIKTTILDSFERADEFSRAIPGQIQGLVDVVEEATEKVEQIESLEARIARTKAIANAVFGLVSVAVDGFSSFQTGGLAGFKGFGSVEDLIEESGNLIDVGLQGLEVFNGLETIWRATEPIGNDWPSELYPEQDYEETGDALRELTNQLSTTLAQTLQRWNDALSLIARSQEAQSIDTVLLETTLTPASSSAVWMSFYREIMYLLKYEYKICPVPALETQFDSYLEGGERRRRLRLDDRLSGTGSATGTSDMRRSLNKKKQLAEAREELGELVDTLIGDCEKFDVDMQTFAEYGRAFQEGIDAFVTHVFSYLTTLGQMQLAQQAPSRLTSLVSQVASEARTNNPWGAAAYRSQQFSEMYRAVTSTDVILLEQQARHSIEELCRAYRFADPRPTSAESLVTSVQGVLVDGNTCQVSFTAAATSPASLSKRVQILGQALDNLASKWYLDYLDNYAAAPSQTSIAACSIVDPYFFQSLQDNAATGSNQVPVAPTFEVNFDSFKNFCQINTELVTMSIVLFDEDWNVLPRPSSDGSQAQTQPTFRIRARSAFTKFSENAQASGGGINAPHLFTSTRDFQFTSAYTIPSDAGGCVTGTEAFVGLNGEQRICSTFGPSQEFADLFLRPTPYASWQVSLISGGSAEQLGGRPMRAQVFFDVDSKTPQDTTSTCNSNFGSLNAPAGVFDATESEVAASFGSTCQWKFTSANRQSAIQTTNPGNAAPAGSDSPPNWEPILYYAIGGVAAIFIAAAALVTVKKRRGTRSTTDAKQDSQLVAASV